MNELNNASKKVAVIILNYSTWKETLNEISVCRSVLNIDTRDITIIDNCSPNDSAIRLQEESLKQKFNFIKSDRNKGYAAGNNLGLRFAFEHNYSYALILNNDILFSDSELIKKLIEVFSLNKSIAVVNPEILSAQGHLYNRDSIRPSFWHYTFGMVCYKKAGRKIKDNGGYAFIYRPQGCCMMVDLEKLNQIDFMDENTFLYCEEPILAEKLLKLDYKCALCTRAQVVHNHSATVCSVFKKRKRINIINTSFQYYLKTYRKFNSLQIKICLFFNFIKLMILK